MIAAQMTVLNDSFSGATAPDAADTPFRFALDADHVDGQRGWSTVARARSNGT